MPTTVTRFAILFAALATQALAADDGVLEPGSEVVRVAGDCKFTEGPVFTKDGVLLFSDGSNNRIMQLSPDGKLSVFRQPSGRTNGMALDAKGRLLMCQSSGDGGGRRVARLEVDGTETVLADKYDGKRFIGPNDICVDAKGRIYFTDPDYGQADKKAELPSGVYRIELDKDEKPAKLTRLTDKLQRPNGIALSADGTKLFVSDRGTQKLHRFVVSDDIKPDGIKPDGIVYDFSPDRGVDGMRLDVEGNIYAGAGEGKTTGLFVVSPAGKLLLHKPLPEFTTNVCFGGKEGKDLFVTAGKSVYRLRTVRAGLPLPIGSTAKK